jgi:hypothetical protein
MYRSATLDLRARLDRLGSTDANLGIHEIIEPPRWSSHYDIGFYCHNGGADPILMSGLMIKVLEVRDFPTASPVTPGAPSIEYSFEATLTPEIGRVSMMPLGPRSFNLKSDETEFFRLDLAAYAGHEYRLRLGAKVTNLARQDQSDVLTPDFWLAFAPAS